MGEMTGNSSATSVILILFAFSDNLSAENSKLSAESGLPGLSLLESMDVARIISSQKIYGLYGLKHHTVEMRRGVTDAYILKATQSADSAFSVSKILRKST